VRQRDIWRGRRGEELEGKCESIHHDDKAVAGDGQDGGAGDSREDVGWYM
jgi:hypothetical protein